LFAITATGCSYITNLAVVNLSDRPIEVRYRIRFFPGPFHLPVTPATKPTTQLDGDTQWNELPVDQYKLDPEGRTVTLTLMPKTAVLVEQLKSAPDDPDSAARFDIEEMIILGAYGEMRFRGEQLRKAFRHEWQNVFSLTYK
jgi:hypothetical protein